MANIDKINKIINKYKGNENISLSNLYREIVFQNHGDIYIRLDDNNINIKNKNKYIDLTKIVSPFGLETDKNEFKNYKNSNLALIGNMGGLNYGIVNNKLFAGRDSIDYYGNKKRNYDFINERVMKTGGKFYIDIRFHKIRKLSKEEFLKLKPLIRECNNNNNNRGSIIYNKKKYYLYSTSLYSNSHWEDALNNYDKVPCDLIVTDHNQIILTKKFIFDLFEKIDNANMFDAIGVKYFQHALRKDRINIYTSEKIKSNEKLSKSLIKILKELVIEYQQYGLEFRKNNFIMPYEFDPDDKIIANVYTPDSFTKILLFFILLYNTRNEKLLTENISEILEDSRENHETWIAKSLEHLKLLGKDILFPKFVHSFLNLSESKIAKDYIKTYKLLFSN